MLRKKAAAALLALAAAVSLSACDKALEPYQDAPVGSRESSTPADLVSFPDGYSNVATKCDHGNRIYTAFHGDSTYAAIAVVPNDLSCPKK